MTQFTKKQTSALTIKTIENINRYADRSFEARMNIGKEIHKFAAKMKGGYGNKAANGEDPFQIIAKTGKCNVGTSMLRNYEKAYIQYAETGCKDLGLSIGHYVQVFELDLYDDQKIKLLNEASKHGWTIGEMVDNSCSFLTLPDYKSQRKKKTMKRKRRVPLAKWQKKLHNQLEDFYVEIQQLLCEQDRQPNAEQIEAMRNLVELFNEYIADQENKEAA